MITTPLFANWQGPENVSAFSTLRQNTPEGFVFDKTSLQHRQDLVKNIALPASPEWLDQVHSSDCVRIETTSNRKADAAITQSANKVLAILTADCLPVVLTNATGSEIAVIHAGWRGLCNGIIENTLQQMQTSPSSLIAWIGPSICCNCYETGPDVFDAFHEKYAFASRFFHPVARHKWLTDLAGMASQILQESRISAVFLSQACTFEQRERFYSWRREGQTGRIATLAWFT